MQAKITLLPGDGIGPEVLAEAVKVLNAVANKHGHQFSYQEGLIGAAAIDATGSPLPDETRKMCLDCDGVLLAAVGDLTLLGLGGAGASEESTGAELDLYLQGWSESAA